MTEAGPRLDERGNPASTPSRDTWHRSAAVRGQLVGTAALVLGAWLVVSSFALGYPASDPRTDAFLNEALAGIVLIASGFGRMRSPASLPKVTVLQGVVSAWLIAAPFVVGYGEEIPRALTNDVASGIGGVLLAGLALLFAERRDPAARTV